MIPDSYSKIPLFEPFLFITHIAKTGGTSLEASFRPFLGMQTRYGPLMMRNPENMSHDFKIFKDKKKYVLFVREPISRFLSAFETVKKYFSPVVAPFRSANELAEQLSSPKRNVREKAKKAMRFPHFRSIGYYLRSAENVYRLRNNLLFVGRLEHFEYDFRRLTSFLVGRCRLQLEKQELRIYHRMNRDKGNRTISLLARNNIRKFYAKDYECFRALCDLNLLSRSYLNRILT